MDETSNAHDRERYPASSPILVDVSGSGDARGRSDAYPLPSLDGPIPALFVAAGAALTVVGALAWVAVLAGAGGITWTIRVLAGLALVVGAFVVLVGIGLFRARWAVRVAAAQARLDAELDAAAEAHAAAVPGRDAPAPDSAHTAVTACADDRVCAGCDAACAVNALRK